MSVAYPEPRPAPPPRSTSPGPVSLLLRLALGLLALAIPIAAVWLMTALFMGLGAPMVLALVVGVLVPLGLPFAWDFWAEAQFRKKQNPSPRILSRADRIRLRILAVCLLALAVPVLALGRPTSTAIARHGAWFMGSSQSPFANDLRYSMRGLAVSLASITGTSPDLGTVMLGEAPAVPVSPVEAGAPDVTGDPSGGPSAGADPTPTRPGPAPRPTPRTAGEVPRWPLPEEPHPVVRAMTDAQASDLDAVARLIAAREADPFQRVKAIHDFVVRWVQYDTSVLDIETKSPPQDAETVFSRKTATCDGYAKLMIALGERIGITMTRIVGRSRVLGSELDGFYHAWVGVEIDGKPYLVDPTWDAGSVFGRQFNARYSTAYLFAPPEIFAYDHLPKDPDWSLTEPPLDRETFLSRPALSAGFFARGLSLEGITKATTEVEGRVTFSIKNPKKQWVLVLARPLGDGQAFNCVVPSQVDPVEASCALTPGTWELGLYANDSDRGSFPSLGFLRVVAR